jgi:uncharacterized membrane protein (UPF0127 family)
MFKQHNKYLGLMFRNIKGNTAILKNYNRESLHTLFVFYPIDIIFLDKNKKVIEIKKNIKPFTLKIIPNKKAKYVLECKARNSKNIRIGQTIKFKYKL